MGLVEWYLQWCDRWMPGYSRPDPGDKPDEAPCAQCGAVIDYDASACPECGNNPAKKAKWATVVLMFVGLVLSATVIGAVIGIPLFVIGLLGRIGIRYADYSPTEHDY